MLDKFLCVVQLGVIHPLIPFIAVFPPLNKMLCLGGSLFAFADWHGALTQNQQIYNRTFLTSRLENFNVHLPANLSVLSFQNIH
jgi:hypothetical protein